MKLSPEFEEALVFASRLHSGQRRKGTKIPYVAHLLCVAGIALEYGATEVEAIAALLHDAIEDQGGAETREKIRRRFGDEVVNIVDGCTDAEVIPKLRWLPRKKAYLRRLPDASSSIWLVSAADKFHNAQAILRDYRVTGEALWRRFNGRRKGTLWYYRSLVDVFSSAGGPTPRPDGLMRLIGELGRVVTELESLCGAR